MTSHDVFLGGVAPRTTARSVLDSAGFMSSIKKEDRAALTANNKLKLKEAAKSGLESKYDLLDAVNSTDLDALKSVYSISIKNEELKAAFRQYDMAGVMTCPSSMTMNANGEPEPASGATQVDLFNNVMEVELSTLKDYSRWMMAYGQDFHVENLYWTGNKILNSCSSPLRMKLEEATKDFATDHRTGPVYFYLMTKLILSSTPMSMRTVMTKLEGLAVKDFTGESVLSAVSLIRGAVGLLDNNGARPVDIINIVFKIMKRVSTIAFQTYVTTLETNQSLKMINLSLEEVLLKLESRYTEMVNNGEWSIGTKDADHEAVFVACYRCGQEGHMKNTCMNDPVPGSYERVRSIQRARGQVPSGRGRGRGRDRRNGGSQRGTFGAPPQSGQSHVRKRGNITEKWCGKCSTWGSHLTQQHDQADALICRPVEEVSGSGSGSSTDASNAAGSALLADSSSEANTTSGDTQKGGGDDASALTGASFAGLMQDF